MSNKKVIVGPPGSELISWDQAKQMIINYDQSEYFIPMPDGTTRMRGLMVDVDNIRQIIGDEDSGVNEVFIMFAIRDDEDDPNVKCFTNVLAGVKDGLIQTNPVVDFCKPCPSVCANYAELILPIE